MVYEVWLLYACFVDLKTNPDVMDDCTTAGLRRKVTWKAGMDEFYLLSGQQCQACSGFGHSKAACPTHRKLTNAQSTTALIDLIANLRNMTDEIMAPRAYDNQRSMLHQSIGNKRLSK